MRRHVVGAFRRVAIERRIFTDQAGEKGFKIALHVGVGIFLDRQSRRGMAPERRPHAGRNILIGDPATDLAGDFRQSLSRCFYAEFNLCLVHPSSLVGHPL